MSMELRSLGSTGLVLSHGLAWEWLRWEGPATSIWAMLEDLEGEASEAAMEHCALQVLDTAWKSGIRYFDVARSYGRGEEFLAIWLRSRSLCPIESSRSVLKWGYTYTADWKIQAPTHEIKNHSLAALQRQWGESVSRLNGYLDLYQIHSATMESGALDDHTVLDELAHLKSEGIPTSVSRQADRTKRQL